MAGFLEAESELYSGAKERKEYATALFSVGKCLGSGGMSSVT